jgi:nucleobase:cation symporter-1, NCS1 family
MTAAEAPLQGVTKIESHSIDYIPESDRHGKPWHLFPLWFNANMNVMTIAAGALCVATNLSLTWTIIALVIGHLVGGVFMALHSAQGPVLGIPQMIQSRAQFGYVGAMLPLILVVLMYLGYFTASTVLGAQSLATLTGMSLNASTIVFNVVTTIVAIWGYRLVHGYSKVIAGISIIAFAVLTFGLLHGHDLSAVSSHVGFSWASFFLAVTVAGTWQLTYCPYVADYSRYLPSSTSKRASFWFTYAASVSSSVWFFIFGVIAAMVAVDAFAGGSVDFIAAQAGGAIPFFLIVVVAGILLSNVLSLYGFFMSTATIITTLRPMAFGLKSRIVLTTVTAILGTCLAIFTRDNFLTNLMNFILLLAYFIVPWTAVNLVDFYWVRREKYNIPAIFDPSAQYGGLDWRAIGAYLIGVAAEIPFINTAVYQGPISTRLGGVDISWLVGVVVAAVAYYALMRKYPVRRGVSAFGAIAVSGAEGSAASPVAVPSEIVPSEI